MLARIVALLILALAVVAAILYSQTRSAPLKVSGFVEQDEMRLGSRVGGRVLKVLVQEGQAVTAGQALVELDPFDLLAQQTQAAANVQARKAEYDKLKAGFRVEEVAQAKARRDELAALLAKLQAGPRKEAIAAARARLAQAKAEAEYAQANYDRFKRLYEGGTDTREQLDKSTQALQSATAMLDMRQAELAELEAGNRAEDIEMARRQWEQAEQAWKWTAAGPRPEDIESARAAWQAAQAALKATESQIAELRITAPADGVIESCDLQPGDLAAPNAPVLSMLASGQPWVRAYVPEDRVAVKPGLAVRVTSGAFPGRDFEGVVTFAARQAEFTPSNVQTPEKRSEQVFRVKVTLRSGGELLRPGAPVDVWLGGEAGR